MRSPLEFPDLLLLNLEDDHPWEPLPLFATPSYSSPPGEKKKKKINFRFDFVQAIESISQCRLFCRLLFLASTLDRKEKEKKIRILDRQDQEECVLRFGD